MAAPHETTTTSPWTCSVSAVARDDDLGHLVAGLVRAEHHRLGVRQQRDVRVLERRPDAEHLRVRLRVHEAREPVALRAPDARAVGRVRLVEHDPARRVERVVARLCEVVVQQLDPRLVRHGRERIGRARGRLGRVLAARSVHLVELLGLRVVRLQLVVGDRPGRRDAVMVAELSEVLLAEAIERGAVELRRAADEVVHLRLERLALLVVPGVRRDVPVLDEHVAREPVLNLAREPVAALEQQDALSRRRKVPGERPAARTRADDHHVVRVHHMSSSASATTILAAASINARCENACGKLPRWRPVSASNSSAYSPSGDSTRSNRSIRSRARCISPMIARAETSQNEQMRNVPSLPESPSSVSVVWYRSTKPFSVSSSAIVSTVARRRSSSPGRKPKIAASSVDASRASVS